MIHDTNGRRHDAPDASTVLREVVADWQLPDDSVAPAEFDDRPVWPDDADGPRFTFAELIEQEALGYRAWRTDVGDFLARQMERLSQLIRWTGATTPEQHEERMEVWDAEIRDRYWDMGYHEGLEAGRRECRCGTCFMDRDSVVPRSVGSSGA